MKPEQPTPEQVLAARQLAGLTQQQAADLVWLSDKGRWSEYERGTRRMSAVRWAMFKHKTGQVTLSQEGL